MKLLPLVLLIMALPLGVAGQNIVGALIGLLLLALIACRRPKLSGFWQAYGRPLMLSTAYLVILAFATWVNPENPTQDPGRFLAGYVFWLIFPPAAILAYGELTKEDWIVLGRVLAVVCLIWGAITISQAIWGWQVQGASFVSAPTRSRGLYSHPLTLAYAALFVFPLGMSLVVRHPRQWTSWAILFGAGAAIATSQSRTVQAVCALVILFNVLYAAKGKARVLFVLAMLVCGLGVALTDNPISHRFGKTIDGPFDARSGYRDDRLAFWHAHLEMWKDRPMVGHGMDLDTDYRSPYYDEIGLPDFERKYEAHNTFLQTAVNGGLVGLALLLAWFGVIIARAATLARTNPIGQVALQTLIAFLLASMTQNSFQDSEVRYALTALVGCLWLAPRQPFKA